MLYAIKEVRSKKCRYISDKRKVQLGAEITDAIVAVLLSLKFTSGISDEEKAICSVIFALSLISAKLLKYEKATDCTVLFERHGLDF